MSLLHLTTHPRFSSAVGAASGVTTGSPMPNHTPEPSQVIRHLTPDGQALASVPGRAVATVRRAVSPGAVAESVRNTWAPVEQRAAVILADVPIPWQHGGGSNG